MVMAPTTTSVPAVPHHALQVSAASSTKGAFFKSTSFANLHDPRHVPMSQHSRPPPPPPPPPGIARAPYPSSVSHGAHAAYPNATGERPAINTTTVPSAPMPATTAFSTAPPHHAPLRVFGIAPTPANLGMVNNTSVRRQCLALRARWGRVRVSLPRPHEARRLLSPVISPREATFSILKGSFSHLLGYSIHIP